MKATLFAITSIILPLVTATPVVSVDIHITDDSDATTHHHLTKPLDQKPIVPEVEQIPGWVFFEGETFRARIHGNTFWNVKGTLKEKFPLEDFLFDPLLFTLNHPEDLSGAFNGTIGRGQIALTWEKSGATIVGRSPVGDFEVNGETKIDYSP